MKYVTKNLGKKKQIFEIVNAETETGTIIKIKGSVKICDKQNLLDEKHSLINSLNNVIEQLKLFE